jgi:hypothetical protein
VDWTRREFLAAVGPALVARSSWNAVEPFPSTPLVAPFLRALGANAAPAAPTGLSRDGYLQLIDGIVRFFAAHQDARGAIIDPYERRERQYSTPAFALAGAVLHASGRNRELLARVVRAMEASCADLAAGRAADRHADFFTVLLLHADIVLRQQVSEAVSAGWRKDLASLVPEYTYVHQPASGRPLHNWNLVAAAGDFLRTREGYGRSDAWVEASMTRQVERFTPAGMYRDPNDPMAYDHFARLWALDLVEEGYAGPQAARLRELLERAAWASLFMQSTHGELPCGGRSAHHQWNEAEQAVTFETVARRYAALGDRAAAGAFKRAARLSQRSIARWVRPSGELWVVKNRVDPISRHGYESYSFHSQYNLLTAAMLALAWLRADETIGEARVPAETLGYGFGVEPAFHKAFVAVAGTYIEIETGADLHYNPTGIVRLHHRDLPPELFSDGVTRDCDYVVPRRPASTWALGPAWKDGAGTWHSLAEHGRADLEPTPVRVVEQSPQHVEVDLIYRGRLRGGATTVRERVRVMAGQVQVTHQVEGDVREIRGIVPFLVSDGQTETTVETGGNGAVIARGGGRLTVQGGGGALSRAGLREPMRNGFMDALFVPAAGATVSTALRITGRETTN